MERVLVVVTRMGAPRGGAEDEFVQIWGQVPTSEHHVNVVDADRELILIHGYDGRWGIHVSTSELLQTLASVCPDEGEVGFTLHPPRTKNDISEQMPRLLASRFAGRYSFCRFHYQGVIDDSTSTLRALALCVAAGARVCTQEFDRVWLENAGDPELERRLGLLHKCLTPAGAQDYLANDPQWLVEALTEKVKVLAGYESLDVWATGKSGEDYRRILSELRDHLLDGSLPEGAPCASSSDG